MVLLGTASLPAERGAIRALLHLDTGDSSHEHMASESNTHQTCDSTIARCRVPMKTVKGTVSRAALSTGQTHLCEYALVGRRCIDPEGSLAHRRQAVRRLHSVQVLAAAARAAAARVPAVQPVRLEVPRVVTRLQIKTAHSCARAPQMLEYSSPHRRAASVAEQEVRASKYVRDAFAGNNDRELSNAARALFTTATDRCCCCSDGVDLGRPACMRGLLAAQGHVAAKRGRTG